MKRYMLMAAMAIMGLSSCGQVQSQPTEGSRTGFALSFFKAVSAGFKEFEAIAIVGGPEEMICGNKKDSEGVYIPFPDYAYPCGICRQVMQEFCGSDFKIIVAKSTEDYKVYTLKELLPFGFGGKES